MKVRKFLFAGALIVASLFSVNSVMAEDVPPTNYNTATVNIIFTPIQTIVVNPSEKTVDFEYTSIEDYYSGADAITKNNHLTINSSGPFQVYVTGADFTGGIEDKTIDASDIAVLVQNSEGNTLDSYTFVSTPQQLTAEVAVPLFTSSKGGKDLIFDVTYSNPGGKNQNYLTGYLKDQTQTYTATVIYTITAN